MKTKTERRLNKFAEQAKAEVALLGLVGMGKAPGKPVEGMSPKQKYIEFKRALNNAGLRLRQFNDNNSEVWQSKGQGPWVMRCVVSLTHFSMSAVRVQKGEREMSHKPYKAEIPARDANDMKKYVRWVMNKFS